MSELPTRRVGHSELDATVLGLGSNNFGGRLDLDGTRAVIDACFEHGVTFIDTADRYGATRSEEFLGEVLKGRRDKVVLATKFGRPMDAASRHQGASRGYIITASLRRQWERRRGNCRPIE